MIHKLKIEYNYLQNLINSSKKHEIRFNDRDYQLGDILSFNEYFSDKPTKEHLFKITHIHSGLGLKEGYVALSVEPTCKGE